MKFRFQQRPPRGLWTSLDVFEADYPAIVRMVREGHVLEQPRAAVEVGSGRVLFALDARGRASPAAARLFSDPTAMPESNCSAK